jgi:putative addiction module component (TIGR02574 family)
MTAVKDINLDKILALPAEDRQAIVEAIQASLDEEQDPPDWHREIVAERLAAHRADPTRGEPWAVVRERLLAK